MGSRQQAAGSGRERSSDRERTIGERQAQSLPVLSMQFDLVLPDLGLGEREIVISLWLVRTGSEVAEEIGSSKYWLTA